MIELDGPRSREVLVRCHGYMPRELPIARERSGVTKTNGHEHVSASSVELSGK